MLWCQWSRRTGYGFVVGGYQANYVESLLDGWVEVDCDKKLQIMQHFNYLYFSNYLFLGTFWKLFWCWIVAFIILVILFNVYLTSPVFLAFLLLLADRCSSEEWSARVAGYSPVMKTSFRSLHPTTVAIDFLFIGITGVIPFLIYIHSRFWRWLWFFLHIFTTPFWTSLSVQQCI